MRRHGITSEEEWIAFQKKEHLRHIHRWLTEYRRKARYEKVGKRFDFTRFREPISTGEIIYTIKKENEETGKMERRVGTLQAVLSEMQGYPLALMNSFELHVHRDNDRNYYPEDNPEIWRKIYAKCVNRQPKKITILKGEFAARPQRIKRCKKRRLRENRMTKYSFERMEVGEMFEVLLPEKRPATKANLLKLKKAVNIACERSRTTTGFVYVIRIHLDKVLVWRIE